MSHVQAAQEAVGVTRGAAFVQSFDRRSQKWDDLLSQQVRLFSDSEMANLELLPGWQNAETVLDVGCGNGSYLVHLRKAFPRKKFAGVERSKELLDIARHRLLHSDIGLYEGDIVNQRPNEKFDAVILRFVTQHLENPSVFFERLRSLCHDQTCVIIIEPNPSRCVAQPELSQLKELIGRYEALCASFRGARAQINDAAGLSDLVGNSWEITCDRVVRSVHQRPDWNGPAVADVLEGWVDLLDGVDGLDMEFSSVRSEISQWVRTQGQSISIALNMWTLRSCSTEQTNFTKIPS